MESTDLHENHDALWWCVEGCWVGYRVRQTGHHQRDQSVTGVGWGWQVTSWVRRVGVLVVAVNTSYRFIRPARSPPLHPLSLAATADTLQSRKLLSLADMRLFSDLFVRVRSCISCHFEFHSRICQSPSSSDTDYT